MRIKKLGLLLAVLVAILGFEASPASAATATAIYNNPATVAAGYSTQIRGVLPRGTYNQVCVTFNVSGGTAVVRIYNDPGATYGPGVGYVICSSSAYVLNNANYGVVVLLVTGVTGTTTVYVTSIVATTGSVSTG